MKSNVFTIINLLTVVVVITILSGYLTHSHAQIAAKQVDNLRVWTSPHGTRLVFDLSEEVKHKIFQLQNPLRLVIDIEDAEFKQALPQIAKENPHVGIIRTGRPKANQLRFVLELKQTLKSDSFVLSPNELYGHRLVIDLSDDNSVSSNAVQQPNYNQTPASSEATLPSTTHTQTSQNVASPLKAQAQKVQAQRPIMIAIDAGHGGEDPGAIGYRGTHEKIITLSIAKKLKNVINQDPRLQSYLVRTGDYYIKLHKRRTMARTINADMFISIHADAFTKQSANGFSVFALSQRGATSAMARALAAKENASDLIGGVSLADKDDMLAQVLVDLSMTNTISESVNLGGRVLAELKKLGRLHSKRVEQAGFAVLKSADMPSILIETGFITNPTEEKRLRTDSYQQKIAQAIYTAITNYYDQTPYFNSATYASPDVNSNVNAAQRNTSSVGKTYKKYHKVVKGDSLSKIAYQYGTSVRELKRLNKLKSDTAMLGVRLKLPKNKKTEIATITKAATSRSTTNPSVHIVKRGDSLSKISIDYNVTISSLKKFNKLKKDTVYIGQKIKIPGRTTASRAAQSNRPTKHKVKRGDTLSEIADLYGLSMKQIMKANKMRSRTVMLGQTLVIPN